jgi:hypothetical protein
MRFSRGEGKRVRAREQCRRKRRKESNWSRGVGSNDGFRRDNSGGIEGMGNRGDGVTALAFVNRDPVHRESFVLQKRLDLIEIWTFAGILI